MLSLKKSEPKKRTRLGSSALSLRDIKLWNANRCFAIKYKADGTLDRHKTKLVAKGFTQIYKVDYPQTFSHVANLNTIRALLSIVVNKD